MLRYGFVVALLAICVNGGRRLIARLTWMIVVLCSCTRALLHALTPLLLAGSKSHSNIVYDALDAADRPGKLSSSFLEVLIRDVAAEGGGPACDPHINCIGPELLIVLQPRGYVYFNAGARRRGLRFNWRSWRNRPRIR